MTVKITNSFVQCSYIVFVSDHASLSSKDHLVVLLTSFQHLVEYVESTVGLLRITDVVQMHSCDPRIASLSYAPDVLSDHSDEVLSLEFMPEENIKLLGPWTCRKHKQMLDSKSVPVIGDDNLIREGFSVA